MFLVPERKPLAFAAVAERQLQEVASGVKKTDDRQSRAGTNGASQILIADDSKAEHLWKLLKSRKVGE
jgi:hypothetical protein